MSGTNYLERILAVERIVQASPNGITVKQIIEKLEKNYGIAAERKSIYNVINELTKFMPINTKKVNHTSIYYLEVNDDSDLIIQYRSEIEKLRTELESKTLFSEDQKKAIQEIHDTYKLELKAAKAEITKLKRIIEKGTFKSLPKKETAVKKETVVKEKKNYEKKTNAEKECPFFIESGSAHITCEGIINGTQNRHVFSNETERKGYEKFVCSQNCGKNCVHYKRVYELYEKGLR